MELKKILITGVSGFVGQNLQEYLLKYNIGCDCVGRGQLNCAELNINQDCIVHLAGKAHDLKKTSNPDEYYTVNYELTKKLYDAFLKSNANKFIFISSVKASADAVEDILTETHLSNPQTIYGKSKLKAEDYIQSQPLPEGKSYYILRPCMIHGPGNKGNLNLLYHFVKKGVPYPLASFINKRSFLSVENLCFIIKELIEQMDVPSDIYQVADNEALSTNEVVSTIAEALGKNAKLWHLPKSLIYAFAKIGDKFKLPLNTERLNKLTENYVVSNDKIRKVLNVNLPIHTKQGLKITINSFNQQ